MKNLTQSPHFEKAIKIITVLLIALIIFGAGMIVGNRKADFSERWERHYTDAVSGVSVAHGAFGQVMAVSTSSLVIRGPRDIEKVVVLTPQTIVRRSRETATISDIVIGMWVTAIGSPDANGEIDASLVRIMPPPPPSASSTSVASSTSK